MSLLRRSMMEAEAGHPVVVEDLGEVATTGVGREDDDEVVGAALVGDLQGRGDGGATRATDEQTLFLADPAGHGEGVGVGDRDDAVDEIGVVGGRPEVLADTLDQVRTAGAAGVHRTLGVGADHLDRRVLFLEVAADTRESAAGAAAGDEVGDLAVGLAPDLRAGRLVVGQRVGLVEVLVGAVGARDLVHESLGRGVVRLGILGRDGHRAHHDLGAVGAEQVDLFGSDLVGHDEHALVATLGGDDRETDTRVARGRLDDGAAGLEETLTLGVVDHAHRRTVLGRAAGVGHLGLHHHLARLVLRHLLQVDQGRVPDHVENRVVDLHGCSLPRWYRQPERAVENSPG